MIAQRQMKVVLEVGVFLGGSMRQWLAASPDVVVVAVDVWQSPGDFEWRHTSGAVRDQLFRPEGLYHTFLVNNWDVRDRVIPVRGDAKAMLPVLHALGLRPDIVYLDADKSGREIAMCHDLFPGVVISGDDWYWGGDQGFPIRQPVHDFCRAHGRHLKQVAMTWAIDDRPFTFGERVANLCSMPAEIGLGCYGLYHQLRGTRENAFRAEQ